MLVNLASCARPASTPAPGSSASMATATQMSISNGVHTATRGMLEPLSAEPLVVLPLQALRLTVPEWSANVGDQRAYLATVSDEIAFAVRERAFKGKWAFPEDLARAARRNPGYAPDPYTIDVAPLAPVQRDPNKIIAEPLAGQLRAFAGLFNGRYALIPIEMRLAPDTSGGGRASVHLVVVDARAARITWMGDVSGDAARTFSPAIAAGLAGRVADLFTPAR